MIAALILVAIFSSNLNFEAEASLPSKCSDTRMNEIREYWLSNDGIPRYVTEHDIRCNQREIGIYATYNHDFENLTCMAIRHFATKHILNMMMDDEPSILERSIFEWSGMIVEKLTSTIRIEIDSYEGVSLVHMCTDDPSAEEGEEQFSIMASDNNWTQEGVDKMLALLCDQFGVDKSTLRSFPKSCVIPGEVPLLSVCSGCCQN